MDWLSALQQLRRDGAPGVLVTVAEVRGHAPRDPGAKMVVGTEQVWGSVGGGNLEETAVRRARALIAAGTRAVEVHESRLNEQVRNAHGQQCCGGEVRLLLEPFPARPVFAVFGVGHVGFELARILSRLELQLHLVDSRTEQLDELRLADITSGTADVQVHRTMLGELVLEQLAPGAQVMIMTHDHAEDFALCDAVLRMLAVDPTRFGGVGLIGSSAKWARFQRRLREAGHDDAALAAITCPVGSPGLGRPGLGGKEPAVIALGVVAAWLAAPGPPYDDPYDDPAEHRSVELGSEVGAPPRMT